MTDIKAAKELAKELTAKLQSDLDNAKQQFKAAYPELKLNASIYGHSQISDKPDRVEMYVVIDSND